MIIKWGHLILQAFVASFPDSEMTVIMILMFNDGDTPERVMLSTTDLENKLL